MKIHRRLYLVPLIVCAFTAGGATSSEQLALNQMVPESEAVNNDLRLSDHAVQQVLARLDHRLQVYDKDYEAYLLKGLVLFKSGQVDAALHELDQLLTKVPKFHLAYLVKADIMQSRLHVMNDLGASPLLSSNSKEQQVQLKRLRDEAYARLRAYLETVSNDRVPAQMLLLGDSVKTAIMVDKNSHRLYVFENPGHGKAPRLLRDFYVSTGKLIGNKQYSGDLRTPEGVYFVMSYKPDRDLPDLYGIGAFPLNYPNELDRHQGKTGYGIWLHGTDKSYYSRPPMDSEGCVVLTNLDLDAVKPYIKIGVTPVVITEDIDWLDHDAWLKRKDELLGVLDTWQQDWESRDVNKYLSHYSSDFWSDKYNKTSWARYKRAVFNGKTYQKVNFDDISLFTYPTASKKGKPMVVVNLDQHYQSNNFNSDARKRLYLAKGDDGWKLIYEGAQ